MGKVSFGTYMVLVDVGDVVRHVVMRLEVDLPLAVVDLPHVLVAVCLRSRVVHELPCHVRLLLLFVCAMGSALA
eukprot:1421367-Rhodomonas_salina.3